LFSSSVDRPPPFPPPPLGFEPSGGRSLYSPKKKKKKSFLAQRGGCARANKICVFKQSYQSYQASLKIILSDQIITDLSRSKHVTPACCLLESLCQKPRPIRRFCWRGWDKVEQFTMAVGAWGVGISRTAMSRNACLAALLI